MARASCFKKETITALGSFEDPLSRLGTLFPASSSAKMNKGEKLFLENYFDRYTFQPEKGMAYGFEKIEAGYEYQCPVLSDTFLLKVRVCDRKISFQVYDQDTGDEYIQIHLEQLQGNFVGQVREACQESLARIRQACFEVEDFLYPQTKRLMAYISLHYQGTIEYLWERSPESGAIRHRDTLKWYGVFMTIDWNKLDAGKSGKIEVLNVKSDQVAQFVQQKGIYPAFHMNKKYWVSIPLDGIIADEELFALVDSSWQLTKKGK